MAVDHMMFEAPVGRPLNILQTTYMYTHKSVRQIPLDRFYMPTNTHTENTSLLYVHRFITLCADTSLLYVQIRHYFMCTNTTSFLYNYAHVLCIGSTLVFSGSVISGRQNRTDKNVQHRTHNFSVKY